jgi:predicted ATPase
LHYTLALRCSDGPMPRLEIVREELRSLKAGDARAILGFGHSAAFRTSVVTPTRRTGPLISTEEQGGAVKLMLHQDGGSRGQPIPAGHSPRTVVGGTNAAEYPTVLAARREMAAWQLLHLEPSVIRTPDGFGGPNRVDERGGHIAAALSRIALDEKTAGTTLQQVANYLGQLVPEVRSIELDRDETRQQLSFRVKTTDGDVSLGPRALSDGTLRFLALVTLLVDPAGNSVLCMEEPENGIHPARVPVTVKLLQDFSVDPQLAVDEENPLRQVIINTHSPDVVRQLRSSDLLFVDAVHSPGSSSLVSAVEGGWRKEGPLVPIRRLSDFIGGAPLGDEAAQLSLRFGTARLWRDRYNLLCSPMVRRTSRVSTRSSGPCGNWRPRSRWLLGSFSLDVRRAFPYTMRFEISSTGTDPTFCSFTETQSAYIRRRGASRFPHATESFQLCRSA